MVPISQQDYYMMPKLHSASTMWHRFCWDVASTSAAKIKQSHFSLRFLSLAFLWGHPTLNLLAILLWAGLHGRNNSSWAVCTVLPASNNPWNNSWPLISMASLKVLHGVNRAQHPGLQCSSEYVLQHLLPMIVWNLSWEVNTGGTNAVWVSF